MSVSKVWKVEGFDVRPTADGIQNVIAQVQWSLTMEYTDDSTGEVKGRTVCNGYSILNPPDANSFISIDLITESQLLDWSKTALGDKVQEFETQTYNQTLNQFDNTVTRMVFDENGTVVTPTV